MVAPYHQSLGLSARLRMDQPHLLVQRQRRSDDRHAAGVADINRYRIGSLLLRVFVPFDEEFHARDDAFVCAHSRPTVFQTIDWLLQSIDRHGEPHCGKISSGAGGLGALMKIVLLKASVNGTFSKE